MNHLFAFLLILASSVNASWTIYFPNNGQVFKIGDFIGLAAHASADVDGSTPVTMTVSQNDVPILSSVPLYRVGLTNTFCGKLTLSTAFKPGVMAKITVSGGGPGIKNSGSVLLNVSPALPCNLNYNLQSNCGKQPSKLQNIPKPRNKTHL